MSTDNLRRIEVKIPDLNGLESVEGYKCEIVFQYDSQEAETGTLNLKYFSRFSFVEDTSYDYAEYNYFARNLEFNEIPFTNPAGEYIFILDEIRFPPSVNFDSRVKGMKKVAEKIIDITNNDVADIYLFVPNSLSQNVDRIASLSLFEPMFNDESEGEFFRFKIC